MPRPIDIYDQDDLASLSHDMPGPPTAQEIDRLIDHQFLQTVLPRLSPREERVIRMRFGLGGLGEHTLCEIGADLNIGKEAVRRIEMKALRRLRWYACRAFPERAARAGFESKPGPVPKTRIAAPAVATTPPVRRKSQDRHVRIDSKCEPSTQEPPLVSGIVLSVLCSAYVAALGLNTTIVYQVAAQLGVAGALLLCCGGGFLGFSLAMTLPVMLRDFPVDPERIRRGDGLFYMLFAALAGAAGLSDPVQTFLHGLVVATPPRFQNGTPAIVRWFSVLILLLCPAYLWRYHQREHRLRRLQR